MGAAFDLAFSKGLVSNTIQTKTLYRIINLVELRYKIALYAANSLASTDDITVA
jgi:hypothetical protein